jgi:hypothetical protein
LAAALRRLLREPLAHFLVAGGVLFAVYALVHGPSSAGDGTIVVDRRALLTYMQTKANAFDDAAFGAALDALSEKELAELVDRYVAEEALYREAKSLGLDRGDPVIRQRVLQTAKVWLGDAAASSATIDPAALADYFAAHKQEYADAAAVTFTHVFFDATRRGADRAHEDAERALRELNAAHAEFNDAPGHGDAFPFAQNYVDRTFDYVASEFGREFAAALAELAPGDGWQGPLRSAYGEHAVLLTRRTELRYPELDEVREKVEADYRRERETAALETVTRAIRERYRVEVLNVRPPRPK